MSVLLRYQHSHTDDPTNLLITSYTESSPSSPLLPFTITSGAPFYAQPGEFTFDPDEVATGTHPNDQEFLRSDTDVVQLTVKADLGFADLTSYSQYRKEEVDSSIETDYSGVVDSLEIGLPNDNETLSQEFLLNSKPGTRLQWTAGLFYFQNRDTYYPLSFDYFPAFGILSRCCEFGSSATTKSFAAFLDATYEVTPQLFITAGARYSHDWITDAYTIAAFVPPPVTRATQADYDAMKRDTVTPRFVIRYKPTEDSSIYASFTKGYKAGMFDLGGGSVLKVRPEKITAYEVGYKFDNRTISLDVSGFYYDYKDLQVSLFQQARALIINAASSEIYGVEAQMRFNVSDHFQLNAGGAWVHARYTDFPGAPIYTPCLTTPDPFTAPPVTGATVPGQGCALTGTSFPIIPTDLKNVTMQRTPEFTANLGARYRTEVAEGQLMLSANLQYSSKVFFGPSGIQFPQKAYENLSLRAQWTDPSDRFTVALWGDNVTNNRHLTTAAYGNAGIGSNWNKPVTYGLELGVEF